MNGIIDYERAQKITVTIIAKDSTLNNLPKSASTTFNIDIFDQDDHSPEIIFKLSLSSQPIDISKNSVKIEENQTPQTVLFLFVSDNDLSERYSDANCKIAEHPESNDNPNQLPFSISRRNINLGKTRIFQLNSSRTLDRESHSSYMGPVICYSPGSPSDQQTQYKSTSYRIRVDVLDVNDWEPKFEQIKYFKEIEEGNKEGALMFQVKAFDPDAGDNGTIHYSLNDDPVIQSYFSIDSKTGVISAKVKLDRETQENITFFAIAKDGGNPPKQAKANVSIILLDINDEIPQVLDEQPVIFYKKEGKYSTNEILGTLNITDKDKDMNGKFECWHVPNSDTWNSPIDILPNCSVILKAVDLDNERPPSLFSLPVNIKDFGSPSLQSQSIVNLYIVDVNDNRCDF